MVNIGEYVKREKDARGWTLDQLFEKTGIRPNHLSRLINKPPQSPDKDTVSKIAKAFQTTPLEVWKAINEEGEPAMASLDILLSARIGRHLVDLPRDKQEKVVQFLERSAQDYAEAMSAH